MSVPISRLTTTAGPATFSRTSATSCGSAALPRMTVSVTFGAGLPAQQAACPRTPTCRGSACRRWRGRSRRSAGPPWRPASRRARRSRAGSTAGSARCRRRRPAAPRRPRPRLTCLASRIRAVRIEAVGQAAHRAFHHLVDLHLLDVVASSPARPRRRTRAGAGNAASPEPNAPAHQAADDDEGQDRRRDEQDGQAGLEGHEFKVPTVEIRTLLQPL